MSGRGGLLTLGGFFERVGDAELFQYLQDSLTRYRAQQRLRFAEQERAIERVDGFAHFEKKTGMHTEFGEPEREQ